MTLMPIHPVQSCGVFAVDWVEGEDEPYKGEVFNLSAGRRIADEHVMIQLSDR